MKQTQTYLSIRFSLAHKVRGLSIFINPPPLQSQFTKGWDEGEIAVTMAVLVPEKSVHAQKFALVEALGQRA